MTTGIRTVLRFYIKVYIKLFPEIGLCITKPITKFKHRKTDNQSCSVIKEIFDPTVPEGDFGSKKYNNIDTFEPKRPSGNCQVKYFLTDRTAFFLDQTSFKIL